MRAPRKENPPITQLNIEAAVIGRGRPSLANLTPHLMHISATGIVEAPHSGQKLLPARGLAPQLRQNLGFPTSSFPQFLQNIALFFYFVSALEPLHPASSINYTLLAGEERMTLTTYLDFKEFLGRAGGESIAAIANYLSIGIIRRVNTPFHFLRTELL